MVTDDSIRETYMMCKEVRLINPDEPRKTSKALIFFDTGSDCNYVTESMGPVMMPSSIRILLRARQGCYLVVADVEKAFLRVHCGAVSPPFLLAAVIRHLLDEESSKLSAVAKNLYDNVLTANALLGKAAFTKE
uniref:Reverse transcriptase domain-containing protein n=1 Tax=Loa loa TaxID=7209 RepID=A0A1I7V8F3_LOALO